MSLLRAVLGGGSGRRHGQFYPSQGIPPLSEMPWAGSGSITQDEAVRILAIQACVRVLDDTISTLPTATYVRSGRARVEVDGPPWLAAPIASDPNATWEDHLSQLVWSQELDGNSFTLALPSVFDPAEIYVLNPLRVTIRERGRFDLSLERGREIVGPDQVIHIARHRRPGALRGMSPVVEAGTTFAMKRAAERFSERVFNQGIFLSGQMLLPGPAAPDVIAQLKTEIAEQYGGPANAGKPGVFANGARWEVPQLNLQDMQLVELHKMAKLEAAGLFGVPPYLIGVVESGAMAYASVEAQGTDFAKYSISPRVIGIERAYNRLIPGRQSYLKLNLDGLQRADFKSRAEGFQIYLQNKVLRPAEVRAFEDWAPDPEMPGYLETPNNNAPAQGRLTA